MGKHSFADKCVPKYNLGTRKRGKLLRINLASIRINTPERGEGDKPPDIVRGIFEENRDVGGHTGKAVKTYR
jgi:hypothetical protein